MRGSKNNQKTLWFLVGAVGGLILLGWVFLLPSTLPDNPLDAGLDGLQNVVKLNDEERNMFKGGSEDDIIGAAEAEATSSELVDQPRQGSIKGDLGVFSESDIRYLEYKVFGDPLID